MSGWLGLLHAKWFILAFRVWAHPALTVSLAKHMIIYGGSSSWDQPSGRILQKHVTQVWRLDVQCVCMPVHARACVWMSVLCCLYTHVYFDILIRCPSINYPKTVWYIRILPTPWHIRTVLLVYHGNSVLGNTAMDILLLIFHKSSLS